MSDGQAYASEQIAEEWGESSAHKLQRLVSRILALNGRLHNAELAGIDRGASVIERIVNQVEERQTVTLPHNPGDQR